MNSDFCLLHSEPCEVTVHAQEKKKKKKGKTWSLENAGFSLKQTITKTIYRLSLKLSYSGLE